MDNEHTKQEILELVAAGKISAQEAADLLSGQTVPAPPTPPTPPTPPAPPAPPAAAMAEATATAGEKIVVEVEEEGVAAATMPAASGKSPAWFRVRVSDLHTGKRRVSVNIPLRFVKFGVKLGAGFVPEMRGLDWNELNGLLQSNSGGMLVDVEDEESGERVEIFVD